MGKACYGMVDGYQSQLNDGGAVVAYIVCIHYIIKLPLVVAASAAAGSGWELGRSGVSERALFVAVVSRCR